MKDDLFDTQKKIDDAIVSFQSLLNHPGWILIKKIQQANIDILIEQLENGVGENETKESIDLIRAKLKLHREILNTPENLIKKLETGEEEAPNPDPYDTTETIKLRQEIDKQ